VVEIVPAARHSAAMFSRLFGRRREVSEPPAAPAGMRFYAVGDIHGRIDLLTLLHAKMREDAAAAAPDLRKIAVYLGDYVDRGDASRAVIDHLIGEPLPGFERVFLKGNHEAIMLDFLDDPLVGRGWLFNGGDATLYSYGVGFESAANREERLGRMRDGLEAALPPAHRAFLDSLALYHVAGDYLFVHAGIRPGRALDEQTEEDLLWIREEFLGSGDHHGHCVVHGHTISSTPDVRNNRIGIDTGAYFSGRLTCLVLEGRSQRLIQT